MISSQMQVGSRDSPDTPFSLRSECCSLVITGCCCDYLITMFVYSSGCGSSQLGLFFRLFFNLGNLLPLLRWGRYFHTKDDVTDFRLSQRSNIHTETKNIKIVSVNKKLNIHVLKHNVIE